MRLYRLREMRIKNGYTQKQIAALLHICQNTYSDYENGKLYIPISALIFLALLYDTNIDYLLGLTDEDKPYPRKK